MIADQLIALGARRSSHAYVLVPAAREGHITALECAMPECLCPDGRGYFVPLAPGPVRARWAPSADRWPIPGRDGGTYAPENVRLAHYSCNAAAGTRYVTDTYGTEARREWGRKGGKVSSGHDALRRWNELVRHTPDGRAEMARRGKLASHEDHVRTGLMGGHLGGTMGNCQRWRLNRGHACTCGYHATE